MFRTKQKEFSTTYQNFENNNQLQNNRFYQETNLVIGKLKNKNDFYSQSLPNLIFASLSI
jgi:chloramphenicol O-acetyltransferase